MKTSAALLLLFTILEVLVLAHTPTALSSSNPEFQSQISSATIDVPVVHHYNLALVIDPEHHSLIGQADITIMNASPRAITNVPVLLYRLMELNAATDANGRTLRFMQNVVKFPDNPIWQANAIQISLPAPLGSGQTTTIHLKYAGALLGYREVMAYARETISEEYSLLRAEGMPYPIITTPSHAGWRRAFQNKFDYQVETTVPAGYITPCVGKQITEPQTKDGKTTYRCAGPPESNSINIAVAKFRVIDDPARRLRVYAIQADAEAGNRVMNEMRRAIDFFTSSFGPPPKIGMMGAHDGLTVIEIPDGWGSYGLRGYIFQSAAAFKDRKNASELYHEVGHVWNAMVADRVQRTRYFDEAFASYFEALAIRQFEGEQAYRALLHDYRDRYIDGVNRDPLGKTTPIVDYGKYEIGGFSYSKGTWSLYVLHQLVGDDQFKQIIQTFLTQFGEKPADFKDFQDVAERVSHRNLEKYFQEWFYSNVSSQLLFDKVSVAEIIKRY
jgi:Peptidase family M1 domain